jgi:hypothetical protein
MGEVFLEYQDSCVVGSDPQSLGDHIFSKRHFSDKNRMTAVHIFRGYSGEASFPIEILRGSCWQSWNVSCGDLTAVEETCTVHFVHAERLGYPQLLKDSHVINGWRPEVSGLSHRCVSRDLQVRILQESLWTLISQLNTTWKVRVTLCPSEHVQNAVQNHRPAQGGRSVIIEYSNLHRLIFNFLSSWTWFETVQTAFVWNVGITWQLIRTADETEVETFWQRRAKSRTCNVARETIHLSLKRSES